jgi:hypothetical protein
MLRKPSRVGGRVDLIEAHGVMWEKVMDNDIMPFPHTGITAAHMRIRTEQLNNILAAVADYAMIVVDDTFTSIGFHSIYARNYVGALRDAATDLDKLLKAHADKMEDRGQPDPAA